MSILSVKNAIDEANPEPPNQPRTFWAPCGNITTARNTRNMSGATDPEVWNRLNMSLFIKLLGQCCKSGTSSTTFGQGAAIDREILGGQSRLLGLGLPRGFAVTKPSVQAGLRPRTPAKTLARSEQTH